MTNLTKLDYTDTYVNDSIAQRSNNLELLNIHDKFELSMTMMTSVQGKPSLSEYKQGERCQHN